MTALALFICRNQSINQYEFTQRSFAFRRTRRWRISRSQNAIATTLKGGWGKWDQQKVQNRSTIYRVIQGVNEKLRRKVVENITTLLYFVNFPFGFRDAYLAVYIGDTSRILYHAYLSLSFWMLTQLHHHKPTMPPQSHTFYPNTQVQLLQKFCTDHSDFFGSLQKWHVDKDKLLQFFPSHEADLNPRVVSTNQAASLTLRQLFNKWRRLINHPTLLIHGLVYQK